MSLAEIRRRFGPDGITDYFPAYGGLGRITDDTQMSLFTAEGLLRGWVRGSFKGITSYEATVAHAYQRWLRTQEEGPGIETSLGAEKKGGLSRIPNYTTVARLGIRVLPR